MLTTNNRHYAAWLIAAALNAGCDTQSSANSEQPATSGANDAGSSGASDAEAPTQPEGSTQAPPTAASNGAASSETASAATASGHTGSDETASSSVAVQDGGLDQTATQAADSGAPNASDPDAGVSDSPSTADGSADAGETGTETVGATDPELADAGLADPQAAKAYFWEAFTQQRFNDAPEATERLERALEVAPADANLALLVAHSYLWRLAEFGRGQNPDPSQLPALGAGAEAGFQRARAQAPDDDRILGWLGAVEVGNGGASGNPTEVASGQALIAEGVQKFVEFNGFVQSLVNSAYPVGTPEFDLAQQAMWDNLEVCAGFTLDHDAPDVAASVTAVLADGVPSVCRNSARSAHNLEGFLLYFGDVLAKANRPVAALAMYESTKGSPTFDKWPYRETLTNRITNFDSRIAAYTNQDPSDDPVLVSQEPFNCAYCHAASPDEPRP